MWIPSLIESENESESDLLDREFYNETKQKHIHLGSLEEP